MVAKKYTRTRKQKGGGKPPKIGRFSKIRARLGGVLHYATKAGKGVVKGTAGLVAAPIATGVSIAKAGTVAAATAAISTPTRAIQGAIKTPWQLALLGVQKGKEWSARRKLTAAGMHNYENLKKRVSTRKNTLNTLRTQRAKLNAQKLQKQLSGTDTGKGLSSWWSTRQIAKKDAAIKKAEARLEQSIGHKSTRTNTEIASEPKNISNTATKFIAGLDTSKKRQMNAYDGKLIKNRDAKAKPIIEELATLGDTHATRTSHTTATATKTKALKDLQALESNLAKFNNPKILPNGNLKIGENIYLRDYVIKKTKELRDQITKQKDELATKTKEFNKSAKEVAALDAKVAKLQQQKDAYMAQGKTAEQLYGSFQRRKARVQNTKKELGKTAQQLTGIATIKNIGRAVGASFQQDLRTAQKAIGMKVDNTINNKSPGVLAAVGESLTSSKKNLSSRSTAIKHGIEPIGLKIKTLWRGYVNNFSKQGKLLSKFKKDVDDGGRLAKEALAINEEYTKVLPGDVIPPELRARHQALINKREIMTNFADLIAQNRSAAPDPNNKTFDPSSWVAKGAAKENIKLPINDLSKLDDNIKNVVSKFNSAQDYPSQMMYKELYNHLKSIKRWQDSATFKDTAQALVKTINNLLPKELEVLPEFKPQPTPPPPPNPLLEKPKYNRITNIAAMTRAYITDQERRGNIGSNPQEYLKRSINDISHSRSRILNRGNSSPEEIKKYNNLIKDRKAMLKYIIENPDYLKSSIA